VIGPTRARAPRGLTLVELLVATAIFSVLGATIVFFLRQGLATWRAGETRRGAYEEAQAILRQVREDLGGAFVRNPAVPGEDPTVRFICDFDAHGRQRIAFVRTLPREAAHPIAGLAGNMTAAMQDLDGRDDLKEGLAGDLRATGGLLEVAYVMDPRGGDVLYRGEHAPPGGEASLLVAQNVESEERVRALFTPFSSRVLHLEMAFWTQYTRTWDDATPPLTRPRIGARSGPAFIWDSTRAILPDLPGAQADEFRFRRGPASLVEPADDIFPERVLVTLVVAEEGPAATETILTQPLAADGREAKVLSTRGFEARGPFVRIGREWVKVEKVLDDGTLKLPRGSRGRRGTLPADHKAGTTVVAGRTFSAVVEIPASLEHWNE